MKKSYTLIYSLNDVKLRINGSLQKLSYGDSVNLTDDEFDAYSEYFLLTDSWQKPLDEETVAITGGAVSFSKTFEDASADDMKLLKVDFLVAGTMPAGATLNLDVYNAAGSVVEQRSEILATQTDGTLIVFLSGSYLNEASSYKVYGTVPQASGSTYDVTITVNEILKDTVKYVEIVNSGLVSGVNNVSLQLKDASGDIDTKAIVKIAIASDSRGSFAPASLMSGIAAGTDGEIIETADDQYIHVMSEDDGDIDLALTLADAGTPTVNVLTIKGALTDGDLITFGSEVYEFTSGAVSDPSYIKVDITGLKSVGIAALLETVFNANSAYEVVAADAAVSATETVLTVGDVPVDGDFVTFGTEVYEFTTGAVSDPAYIKVDTTDMTLATEVTALFETVFNANTAYDVTAVDGGGTVTLTANDLYTTYNSLATTDTEAGALLSFPATTFGDGAGDSVTGADPYVTFTAKKFFETYNSLTTTDTESGALLAFADATFGGGAGSSTPGVDPASSYYLLIELSNGKRFVSNQLPYLA